MAKVKGFLLSSAPTDNEIAAVTADGNALSGLISQWMQQPQYQANMQTFFANAFQQSLGNNTDYATLGIAPTAIQPALIDNLNQSFARTALAFASQGLPFNHLMDTNQVMMTVPMMAFYAAIDGISMPDNGPYQDQLNIPGSLTIQTSGGLVPIAETVNPASANFMVWYNPNIAALRNPNQVSICPQHDPLVLTHAIESSENTGRSYTQTIFRIISGLHIPWDHGGTVCTNGVLNNVYLNPSDYLQWKMVTIRQPQAGEATSRFYDLPTLRATNTLVLKNPRSGFFTTPSFLGQWNTNKSNQARVTINQALIVALGHAFDGETMATPGMDMSALDTAHAPANSACYTCHQTLDPMRQFFLQQYTYNFTPQTSAQEKAIAGWFDFLGVSVQGETIASLGTQFAQHPVLASAWTQKLCTTVNSAPCDAADPELQRIASVFTASNFNWNTLVRELLNSPVVTYAASTPTGVMNGENVSIARQAQLCTLLSQRLGVTDLCGLSISTTLPPALARVGTIAAALPADTYSRGSVTPPYVTTPDLFYFASVENICASTAAFLVDSQTNTTLQSGDPDATISFLVQNLMGITTSQSAPFVAILKNHFNAAVQAGSGPTTAMQSTFMLACMAPSTVGIGVNTGL